MVVVACESAVLEMGRELIQDSCLMLLFLSGVGGIKASIQPSV